MRQAPVINFLRCGLATVAMLWAATAVGQVAFTNIPAPQQLLARSGDSAAVTFQVRGSVHEQEASQRLTAVLHRGGVVVDSASQTLVYTDSLAGFGVSLQLPVTRANHTLTVALDGRSVATVTELVAGDVFVVNGQSNAIGNYTLAEVDRDSFLRGYQPGQGWTLLQFSNPGQWMGRAARHLSEARDVPVAVFNFAVGAQRLSFFTPGGSGNFEEAAGVLESAGVLGRIRGLAWFQGEADGWEASTASYMRDLSALFDAYRDSFNVEHFYGFQTRTFACGHPAPFVMEAQRRLNRARADVDFVASTNAVNDSCHFVYEGGYQLLGDRLADVILLRQYGGTDERVLSPDVDSARIISTTEIEVYFRDYGAGLAVTGEPWGEFRAEGPGLQAIAGEVVGSRLRLTFAEDITDARGLSYLSHAGPAPEAVHNVAGVGAFTFFNVSLAPGDGAPGNRPDLELVLRSDTELLSAVALVDVQAVVHNTGRASAQEFAVHVPLPDRQLIYVGGSAAEPSVGSFDSGNNLWTIPGLTPGDSAVLQLHYFVADALGEVTVWAEIQAELEEPADEDSEANNGSLGTVHEDDEARLVFNDRSRDCAFGVEARDLTCISDGRDTTLTFVFETSSPTDGGELLLRAPDGGESFWLAGEGFAVTLTLDPALARRDGAVTYDVARVDDPSCATRATVAIPRTCMLEPLSAGERERSSIAVFPNPVRAGASLRIAVGESGQLGSEFAELYDALGRHLGSFPLATSGGGAAVDLPAPAQPGLYFLRIGGGAATIVVE